MAFVSIPGLEIIFQQDFLARFFEEGLDSDLAYRRMAIQEMLPNGAGQTVTITKVGRDTPQTVPLNPATLTSGLDNGLTPTNPGFEQYTYNMQAWGATRDVNLVGDLAQIADFFKQSSRTNGVQAAQSLERIAKNQLFAAYNGGNTFVRGDLSSPTTTHVHVDDIRGFQFVPVNGALQPVSVTYPLLCTENPVGGSGISQTFQVTAAVADTVTQSAFPSDTPGIGQSAGISGILTIQDPSVGAPISGDGIVSSVAAPVLRPNGKNATTALVASDLLTLGLVQDAITQLRNNAVPPMPDGTYHLILSNTSMRELFADQQFNVIFASREDSPTFRSAFVSKLLGVTFITTTEAYVEAPNSDAGVAISVQRPILMGAESLLQGTFSGLESWLVRQGLDPISNVTLVDNVAHVIRPPMDRLTLTASLSWLWIGAYAVPTDLTAVPSIIPSSTTAAYKRCVVLETA